MGIHIAIYHAKTGQEHPTWDWDRHVVDRQVPDAVGRCGELRRVTEHGDVMVRPARPEELPRHMLELSVRVNPHRWDELRRIMESDPDWWLYFG